MGSQSVVLVNNRNIHPSSKMNRSLLNTLFAVSPLLVFVLRVPHVSATVPLVVGTATVLTAEQITALLAIGLAIKAVTLKAALITGASRGRGRRAAVDAAEEIFDIETLVELEEEDCYKRIFCAAGTGKVDNKNVNAVLELLEMDLTALQAPMSRGVEKFATAAAYGKLSRSVDKCENRYQCPLKLDLVQTLFPFQN